MVSESGPEGPKVDPRGARTPFQEPKCDFLKSLVGPPSKSEEDNKNKKKKRKSGNVASVSPITY